MKVSIETHSALEKKLRIEVPVEEVHKKIESVLRDLQTKVKVKGFRPGKVPLDVVKKLYAANARSDALQELVNSSYVEAIDNNHLEIISAPRIEELEFEEGKPLTYTAYVEVNPDITLKMYKELKLVRDKLKEVAEKEVEEHLEKLRESRGKLEEVKEERPSKEGDYLVCDIEVHDIFLTPKIKDYLKRFRLESGKVKNTLLLAKDVDPLGSQALRKNKNEEFEIQLELPKDLLSELKTTKKLPIKITIRELKEVVLPKLDDEFSKTLGKYQNVAEVKADIRKYLEAQHKDEQDQKLRDELLEKLVVENPFSIPSQLLERHEKRVRTVMEENLTKAQHGKSEVDGYLNKHDKEIKKRSEHELRVSLLLNKVAGAEKIEVTKEELTKGLQRIAYETQQKYNDVEKSYRENGWLTNLAHQIRESKTVKFLIDKAQIVDSTR